MFLKIPGMRNTSCRLMILPPYRSTALWAYRRLHRHTAFPHCERMTINIGIPMTCTGKPPRHSRVHLSFLIIVDRCIESRVFEHPIEVRNLSKHASTLARIPFARRLCQSHLLLCLCKQRLGPFKARRFDRAFKNRPANRDDSSLNFMHRLVSGDCLCDEVFTSLSIFGLSI